MPGVRHHDAGSADDRRGYGLGAAPDAERDGLLAVGVMADSQALVIPEPRDASIEAIRGMLAVLPELRRQVLERGDAHTALEIHRRLAALATYVGNRAGKKEVLAEARRTEVLIGELLRKRQQGRKLTEALHKVDSQLRDQFRTLAEHVGVVEDMIAAGKPERPAILAEIADRLRERPQPDSLPDLRLGDFRQVLDDLDDVDAVITDPPYGREFLPLYGDLAVWAVKVLRPDGVLAVMSGQSYLPAVFGLLESGPAYRWTVSYQVRGEAVRSHPANLAAMWKPVILYGGTDVALGSDVVTSERNDKTKHQWGQSESGMANLVERLTKPGWHIVDPFMGAGTTGVAAQALGRSFTGCDIDPDHVATAKRRLGA